MHTGPKMWWQDLAEKLNRLAACSFRIKVKKAFWNVFESETAIQYAGKASRRLRMSRRGFLGSDSGRVT